MTLSQRFVSLVLILCLLAPFACFAEETPETTPPPFRFMTKNDKGDDLNS